MARYATGKFAKAECDRCGWEYPYLSLQKEWNGLKVCPTCWESKHPQLEPRSASDATALFEPRPDSSQNDATAHVFGLSLHVRVLHAIDPIKVSSVTPSGVNATGNIGTVTLQGFAEPSGVSATGNIGTVTGPVSVSGVNATGNIGTVLGKAFAFPDGLNMTGVASTGEIGEENISLSIEETGVSATGNIGTVGLAIDSGAWGTDAWGDNTWGD